VRPSYNYRPAHVLLQTKRKGTTRSPSNQAEANRIAVLGHSGRASDAAIVCFAAVKTDTIGLWCGCDGVKAGDFYVPWGNCVRGLPKKRSAKEEAPDGGCRGFFGSFGGNRDGEGTPTTVAQIAQCDLKSKVRKRRIGRKDNYRSQLGSAKREALLSAKASPKGASSPV
jgi:hypothetical protein